MSGPQQTLNIAVLFVPRYAQVSRNVPYKDSVLCVYTLCHIFPEERVFYGELKEQICTARQGCWDVLWQRATNGWFADRAVKNYKWCMCGVNEEVVLCVHVSRA